MMLDTMVIVVKVMLVMVDILIVVTFMSAAR